MLVVHIWLKKWVRADSKWIQRENKCRFWCYTSKKASSIVEGVLRETTENDLIARIIRFRIQTAWHAKRSNLLPIKKSADTQWSSYTCLTCANRQTTPLWITCRSIVLLCGMKASNCPVLLVKNKIDFYFDSITPVTEWDWNLASLTNIKRFTTQMRRLASLLLQSKAEMSLYTS